MKKYKSLSLALLVLSFNVTVKKNTAPDGESPKLEDIEASKEVVISHGMEAELPSDHAIVKDWLEKGLIEEVKAEEPAPKKAK